MEEFLSEYASNHESIKQSFFGVLKAGISHALATAGNFVQGTAPYYGVISHLASFFTESEQQHVHDVLDALVQELYEKMEAQMKTLAPPPKQQRQPKG